MLTHPTHDRLIVLGLTGMAKALEEQRRHPDVEALSFEERLALLVDREAIERENKRLSNRLKFAGLRQTASIEDADMKVARGLDVMPEACGARRAVRQARRWRLDRAASEPGDHRAIRACFIMLTSLCP